MHPILISVGVETGASRQATRFQRFFTISAADDDEAKRDLYHLSCAPAAH